MKKRMAVMRVSRGLIEDLMSPVKVAGCTACALTTRKEWLHDALKLPANAIVNAVAYDFFRDHVMLRIECPDFRESQEGDALPTVEAFYRRDTAKGEYITSTESPEWGVGVFVRWEGEAVEKPSDDAKEMLLAMQNRSRELLAMPPLAEVEPAPRRSAPRQYWEAAE